MLGIGYPGGKARLSRTIVSFLPKQGRTYVEPFCGRGNLFWSAVTIGLKYNKWWLNDIATIPFFDAVRRAGHTLRVPTRRKSVYDAQKEAFQSGDLRAILLEPYLSFSGGGYFGAGRKLDGVGASAHGYQKTIRQCHRIMQNAKPRLTSLDWREMGLDRLTADDVVVLDPPYPDSNARSYTDEGLNYEALVDLLLRAKFRWILCGYPHPLQCRLGKPFWARDVRFLCVRNTYHREERSECLWSNFVVESKKQVVLPPSVDGKWRLLADASSLSFSALDTKIEDGLETVAKDWNAVVPYLLEMHRRLSAPGRRSDLRKGAPAGLTPQGSPQNRPTVVTSKPANGSGLGLGCFTPTPPVEASLFSCANSVDHI